MSLPDGYLQVEYIESTGTQYIDTGFKPNQDTRVTAVLETSAANDSFFGAQEAWASASFSLGSNTVSFGSYTSSALQYNDGVRRTYDFDKGNLSVDGETVLTAADSFQMSYNMYLLGNNEKNTKVYPSYAKLYACQIYDNGTLVRDFIPCIDADGTAGLWDAVSGTMYKNAGTGAFLTGAPSAEAYTDITPVMTSANTPAGYAATASSTHESWAPWYAFDSVASDASDMWRVWHSSAGVPQWIMLEFPEAAEVSAFTVTNRADFGDYDAKGILSFSLEGSNNGTSFETLGTYTRAGDFSLTTAHAVDSPGTYRYYRLYITECGYVYSGQQYAVIEQIRFYKDARSIPDAPENLTAAYADGAVTLTWTAAENASGYRIYRGGLLIGDTAQTSFADADAEKYGVYRYTVTAYSDDGEGDGAKLSISVPGSADVLSDLITDRTQDDVKNRTKKGVYNAHDLNRVSSAAAYVRALLTEYGYLCGEDARADWEANEIPRLSQTEAHHAAVTALDVIRYAHDPVKLPVSLETLTWEDANAIEAFLLSCGRAAERIPLSWLYCGEIGCGEV